MAQRKILPAAPRPAEKSSTYKLLEAIIENYGSQKGCASPTHSVPMQAFQLLRTDLSSAPAKDHTVYRSMLAHAIYYAERPAGIDEPGNIGSMETSQLEETFLDYYNNNYFTARTKSSLRMLYERVSGNRGISERKRLDQLVRSRVPSTSTAKGDESTLTDEEEYKIFGENYAILLVLKKLEVEKEKKSEELKLSSKQFNLYQSIFISAGLGMPGYSHEQLIREFKLSAPINAAINQCKQTLASAFPDALKPDALKEQKSDLNKGKMKRQEAIIRIINTRMMENSSVLKNSRLDNVLAIFESGQPPADKLLVERAGSLRDRAVSLSSSRNCFSSKSSLLPASDSDLPQEEEVVQLRKNVRRSGCIIS